jgi:hypothetical protein
MERSAHMPAQDYFSLSDSALLALHGQLVAEIDAAEKPSLWQRFSRGAAKTLAAGLTFAATLLVADQTFLRKSRAAQAPESTDVEEQALSLVGLPKTLVEMPEGETLVWSCVGCVGCAGGMGGACFPAKIASDHPERSRYKAVQEGQLQEFRKNFPNHPQQVQDFYAQHPEDARAQIRGVLDTPSATPPQPATSPSLERQGIATGAIGAGLAMLAWQTAERLLEEPGKKHTHHLKHELQHVEDVLAMRARQTQEAMIQKVA